MIVLIKNKSSQKALDFLESQKNLPVLFLVSKSYSWIVVEVDDDDKDDFLELLDSKGFDYEDQVDENQEDQSKEDKHKKKKASKHSEGVYTDMSTWPF